LCDFTAPLTGASKSSTYQPVFVGYDCNNDETLAVEPSSSLFDCMRLCEATYGCAGFVTEFVSASFCCLLILMLTKTPAFFRFPTIFHCTLKASTNQGSAAFQDPLTGLSMVQCYRRVFDYIPIYPGYDAYGNDLAYFSGAGVSASSCSNMCDATAGCVGFVLDWPSVTQCWLKSVVQNSVVASDRQIFQRVTPYLAVFTGYTCSNQPMDFLAVSTLAECIVYCEATSGCQAILTDDGSSAVGITSCWLLPAATQGAATSTVQCYMRPPVYFSLGAYDVDTPVLAYSSVSRIEDCIALCETTSGCLSFVTDYPLSQCWMRGPVGSLSPNNARYVYQRGVSPCRFQDWSEGCRVDASDCLTGSICSEGTTCGGPGPCRVVSRCYPSISPLAPVQPGQGSHSFFGDIVWSCLLTHSTKRRPLRQSSLRRKLHYASARLRLVDTQHCILLYF